MACVCVVCCKAKSKKEAGMMCSGGGRRQERGEGKEKGIGSPGRRAGEEPIGAVVVFMYCHVRKQSQIEI